MSIKPGRWKRNEGEIGREFPDQADHDLEDPALRTERLADQDDQTGLFCLNIGVGDELGQFFITPQFLTKPGKWEVCQEGQDELLLRCTELVREALQDIAAPGTEWTVDAVSQPCPHSQAQVRLEEVLGRAVQVAVGNETAEHVLNDLKPNHAVRHQTGYRVGHSNPGPGAQ
jgi:hypothetical protein